MRTAIIASLLVILFHLAPASARILNVPSEYPTIQQAVDDAAISGDVILIAPGSYPENVAILSKSIGFTGAGLENTAVTSFTWANPNFRNPVGGALEGLHVGGQVDAQLLTSITIHQCLVDGATTLRMWGNAYYASVFADSSEFRETVAIMGSSDIACQPSHNANIRDCAFHANLNIYTNLCNGSIRSSKFYGSAGASLHAYQQASVTQNTLLGTGDVTIRGDVSALVTDNALSGGIILVNVNYPDRICDVSRNTGARSIRIGDGATVSVTIEDNVVASGEGIQVHSKHAAIRRNVILGCSRGIRVWPSESPSMEGFIENNTIYGCIGTGIGIYAQNVVNKLAVQRNLVTQNGTGIEFQNPPGVGYVVCNDVVDNAGGNWVGADYAGIYRNFALKPQFCDSAAGDFTLGSSSPCLPQNGTCDLVGALGEGCASTGACCQLDGGCTVTTEAGCEAPGTWQGGGTVCDPSPCTRGACCQIDGSCVLTTEAICRSPNIWQGPGTECDLDPCFVGACCRVTSCDQMSSVQCTNSGGVFMGHGSSCAPNPCVSGVEDAAQATALSLTATPNPSTGQVMIRYALPKPTAVTIEVFNTAGALVRRIAEGQHAAGAFETPWDGRDDHGRELATGVYFARVVMGEGMSTARVVVAR